jgi:hypothetical protein
VSMRRWQVNNQIIETGIHTLIIAGWTGRDRAAVEHHIAELEAIGVKRPRTTPCFYRVGANLLTSDEVIEVPGEDSSGEVEFVLVSLRDGLCVGVGSDHTDRKVEAYGVTVSKQMCPKPISENLWRLSAVEEHWDQLILRSYTSRQGVRRLYQEGSVASMMQPRELLRQYQAEAGGFAVGSAMYCGTLPVIGPLEGGDRFEVEIEDPVTGRKLTHGYTIKSLVVAD